MKSREKRGIEEGRWINENMEQMNKEFLSDSSSLVLVVRRAQKNTLIIEEINTTPYEN